MENNKMFFAHLNKVVSYRPIHTFTPTDTRAHIDRYARSHRPI